MANRSRLDPQDRSLLDAIENAESIVTLSRLMTPAMGSRSSEVRQAMVDALADKGRKGANELAYFITDPDDDVYLWVLAKSMLTLNVRFHLQRL